MANGSPSKKTSYVSDDCLSLYYKDVEGTHLLTAKEERKLLLEYRDTESEDAKNNARDLVVQGALRYVISEARKHPRSHSNRSVLEDLIAAGNIGLVRALGKFNPDAGTRFLTYAGWWVKHEMREEARRLGLVHVPAHAVAKGVRSPITTELTENSATDDYGDSITQINTERSLIKLLDITALTIREAFIVKTCYGVHTTPKTLKQIGKVLSITGERVRQLRESALNKLRNAAASHHITY